jgi:hypothetical protein
MSMHGVYRMLLDMNLPKENYAPYGDTSLIIRFMGCILKLGAINDDDWEDLWKS